MPTSRRCKCKGIKWGWGTKSKYPQKICPKKHWKTHQLKRSIPACLNYPFPPKCFMFLKAFLNISIHFAMLNLRYMPIFVSLRLVSRYKPRCTKQMVLWERVILPTDFLYWTVGRKLPIIMSRLCLLDRLLIKNIHRKVLSRWLLQC